jgi:hypothetical protein
LRCIRDWLFFAYPDCSPASVKTTIGTARNNPGFHPDAQSKRLERGTSRRTVKHYRTLESFQEYILIDQSEIHVEQFSKTEKRKWLFSEYEDENDTLEFSSIPFQMPISAIYKKVKF